MTPDTGSFDLHRRLPLPPDRLWPILTDPAVRGRWNGPVPDMDVRVEQADHRVGGLERHRYGAGSTADDMPEFAVETRWYHLAAPDRAAFTETVVIGDDPLFTSLVTYVLTPAGSSTDLHVTVAVSSFSGPEALGQVQDGWTGGLANLDAYVAAQIEDPAA